MVLLSLAACERYDPPKGNASGLYASCCEGAGMCLPEALIDPEDASRLPREACGEALLCAPREAAGTGSYVPARCDSVLGFEGRCLPSCLPEVQSEIDRLPTEGCPAANHCAPCYDPITLEPTGACSLGDDPGPSGPPPAIERCCGELGRCIEASSLSPSEQMRLGQDLCTAPALCVPERWLQDEPLVPMSCRSVGDAEGRCLLACLPEIAERASELEASGCPAAHLCAPCFDPVSGQGTGACEIGDDPGPTEPPKLFSSCCGDLGRCVPQSIVPDADKDRLGTDACTDAGALCVPERWLEDGPLVPESCRAPGDLEGRCLPACLPEIAERAEQLTAASCAAGHLCTPCFDPLDGSSTGACEIGDDPGPVDPPVTFGDCCGELGRCAPESLVVELASQADADRLGVDDCTEDGALCVPEGWLEDGPLVAVSCRAPGDLEGRCLPACLPEVAARADQLSVGSCAAGHLCTPCFDPIDGTSTGACEIGDDPGPVDPPSTFGTCCESRGRCVPRDQVLDLASQADADRLGADACTEQDALCVPEPWLEDEPIVPAGCRAPGDLEGRCLLACLPDVAERADQLTVATCDAGHLCTPCFDPLDGASTGACEIGDDSGPVDPPVTFGECCGDLGRCVPGVLVTSLASESDAERLGTDVCSAADALCVPDRWLEDGPLVPQSCRAPGDLEGRCLPACLPDVASRADQLRIESCPVGHLCTPCFDPLDGASTGACEVGDDPGPVDAPVLFDTCCRSDGELLGRCLPLPLLSSEQAEQLPADTCDDDIERCVPNQLIDDPDGGFEACRAAFEDGACIPGCMLSSAAWDILSQRTCPDGMRCAPCSSLEDEGVECPD